MTASNKVFKDEQYKAWKRCIWVKCIQGIGTTRSAIPQDSSKKKKPKSMFDGACPDLKEDHLKVAVLKASPNYLDVFGACSMFSELQSQNNLKDPSYVDTYTDFRVTPHSLQQAANIYKVDISDTTKFLENLCAKPMEAVAYNFLKEYGVKAFEEKVPGVEGEYQYIEDTTLPYLGLELQSTTHLRDHQKQALAAVFPPTRVPRVAVSGVLEMPCGSGKTLTGIAIACKIQRSTLVLCNNSNAVDHWRSEFLRFSNISERGITRATGEIKDELFKVSGVLITTYSMLAVKEGKSKHSQYLINTVKNRIWGLVLFDEVHHLPASGISSVAATLQAKCKVGLTGTLNREDAKLVHLDTLVGPCLFRTTMQFLREQQLVANIAMKQVTCEMTPEFLNAYNCVRGKSAHRVRSILSVLSPHKLHTVMSLIKKHESQGDKILVFIDNKFEIQEYAKRLSKPFVSGDSDKQYRESTFNKFLTGTSVNTILITRTGDESLNLPIANVVIQTSFHHGANNQEMQRLGRILRPKPKDTPGNPGEIEGVFYSLVSKGTREMVYAKRRRKLVVADGIDYIEEAAVMDEDTYFPPPSEQARLLQEVLAMYSETAWLEAEAPSSHAKKVKLELERQEQEEEDEDEDESSSSSDSDEEEEEVKGKGNGVEKEKAVTNGGAKEKEGEAKAMIEKVEAKENVEPATATDNLQIVGAKRKEPECAIPVTTPFSKVSKLGGGSQAKRQVFVPNLIPRVKK